MSISILPAMIISLFAAAYFAISPGPNYDEFTLAQVIGLVSNAAIFMSLLSAKIAEDSGGEAEENSQSEKPGDK